MRYLEEKQIDQIDKLEDTMKEQTGALVTNNTNNSAGAAA
jgi:hypothetical protein